MKLFVWDKSKGWETRFFCALAETEEQARDLVLKETGCYERDVEDCPSYVYDTPVGFAVTHSG